LNGLTVLVKSFLFFDPNGTDSESIVFAIGCLFLYEAGLPFCSSRGGNPWCRSTACFAGECSTHIRREQLGK